MLNRSGVLDYRGHVKCDLFWQCFMGESYLVRQNWPDMVYGLNPVASR
jgi:hypothetical protein